MDDTAIKAALASTIDPNTGKDFISAKAIKKIDISAHAVHIDVVLGYPAKSQISALREQIITAVKVVVPASDVTVTIESQIIAHTVQQGVKLIPHIKNIIAVASGKGGVGKSTTAVNLAIALVQEGATVGLLDADIYGPSQPHMLGIAGAQPESHDGNMMEPLTAHGLQVMSIGFLVDADTPMIWRGPMVSSALDQLINQTRWQDLDYLIVDMPPGTGDTQLSLAQKVPVTGAIIVTTPQDIALIDARKGLKMFEKVHIPIVGIVENMSFHICSGCGQRETIFGTGGGAKMCADYGVELLGRLPLERRIQETTDSGQPVVVADKDSESAAIYRQIARRMAVKISEKAKDRSSKIPPIVVQNK